MACPATNGYTRKNKNQYVFVEDRNCNNCIKRNKICQGKKCDYMHTCRRCLQPLPKCRQNFMKNRWDSDSILPCLGCGVCQERQTSFQKTGFRAHCFICANLPNPRTGTRQTPHCEVHCHWRFDPVYDRSTPWHYWPRGKYPNICGFCRKGHHTSLCVDRPIHVLLNRIRNPKKKAEE